MSIKKTDAIIITVADYRETSKMFLAFSLDDGPVRLLAKGVKRPRQRLVTALLQPFAHVRLQYYQRNPSALALLQDFEVLSQFSYLGKDLLKFGLASVFLEIIAKASSTSSKSVFSLALAFLRQLESSRRPLNLSLCFFYRLIATLGYRPSLDHCAKCSAQTGLFALDIKRGGILCKKCFGRQTPYTFKLQLGDIKVLQRCLSLPINKITSINIMQNQVKTLLPLFFQLAKFHLDIQINSEKFLNHLLKLDSK